MRIFRRSILGIFIFYYIKVVVIILISRLLEWKARTVQIKGIMKMVFLE